MYYMASCFIAAPLILYTVWFVNDSSVDPPETCCGGIRQKDQINSISSALLLDEGLEILPLIWSSFLGLR